MNEKEKIDESKYFYNKLIELQSNEKEFKYNLSAFLSASRTVLQYSLKEAECKPGGKNWYDQTMSSNDILKYFKDKRDLNIHYLPIEVNVNTTIPVPPALCIIKHPEDKPMKDIVIKLFSGQALSEEDNEVIASCTFECPDSICHEPAERAFVFVDWPGAEDVLTLCQHLIIELEKIVKDGVNNGYLTP